MIPNTFLTILTAAAFFLSSCKNEEKKPAENASSTTDSKVAKIKLQPGFKAEHLYSPFESGTGSWVSLTFDNKGRMIASDQYGAMYRLEIPPIGTDSVASHVKVEKLHFNFNKAEGSTDTSKVQMGYAQGLVWAFNSLFVVVNHKGDSAFEKTSGFYRLQDTDNDDQFDKITLLKKMVGEQEHGPHSVKLSPDGKSFYIIAGNNTELPENINTYRAPAVWQRDNILPDLSRYDARSTRAAGWIAHVDSSGKNWELVAAGFRNPFDIAFNESGDLFTYDSDMEWDIGMTWYRPTRICHVPSGGEFGWRDGNAKWSPNYLDNLPPVLNIGQGSPTNMISLADARFPKKYNQTLLASDWSFGIMYSIHLEPDGSSYSAHADEFLSGTPLPLADGVIGPDGALYFLTGGRRLTSDLYRVYYEDGKGQLVSEMNPAPTESQATKTRRQLEEYHVKKDAKAIELAWPYLKDNDRFIRFAARIAIENQPVSTWKERALNEKDPITSIHAIAALARHGNAGLKSRMFNSLMSVDYASLSKSQQLDLLRSFELTLSRLGKPDASQNTKVINYLTAHYPADNNELNRSLSKILVFIGDPAIVEKTLALIDNAKDDTTEQQTVAQSSDLILRNPQYGMDIAGVLSSTPPAQQIYYAIVLSDAKSGWTEQQREKYFRWFYKAYGYKGGRHYLDFMNAAKKSALSNVPKDKYKLYDSLSTNIKSVKSVIDWVKVMSDGGPGRQWKLKDAEDTVKGLANRDFEQSKAMFTAAACNTCHAIRGEGGSIGPDLTQLGTRFTMHDILESIIDPNKVISDQYASTLFSLKDGNSVLGRLIREDDQKYYISQNPFAPETLKEVDKKNVASTKMADVSLMPPLLINNLNPERLRDLMAYLISGGNKDHPVFKK